MDLYKNALEYYENGDLDSASTSLNELLEAEDQDSDAWNFLGIINLKQGNLEDAKEYFLNCIYLNPQNGLAYYNLGVCYQQLGDENTALRTYEIAKGYIPDNIDLLLNIAVIYKKLEKYSDAEKIYNNILLLNPDSAETLNNLANLKLQQSNFDEAAALFTRAISLDPGNSNYFYNLANCYLSAADYVSAEHFFRETLILQPDHSEALNNLGILYTKTAEYGRAEFVYKELLKHFPDNYNAYFNLASCYNFMGKQKMAIESYEKAYELNPDAKGALINLGNIYQKEGEYEKSDSMMNQALEDPKLRALAITNLGLSFLEQGDINEASNYFKKALNLFPDIPEAHYNLSHIYLLSGNFERGWEEYEWRFKRKDNQPRKFKDLLTREADVAGKRILVLYEQGLGDVIQFVRYLKLLKDKGAFIIFECDGRLFNLFKCLPFIDELLLFNSFSETDIIFDYHIHLMSLPWYFKTDASNIPSEEKYLTANEEYVQKWKNILEKDSNFKIGIVWAGNPKHTGDKKRSCQLRNFMPLFSAKKCSFYSLQKNFGLEQLKDFALPVSNLDTLINNFEDTAAVIANMDLVITVDTSVAHLAGALGKPVWLLLPAIPDWRWLLKGRQTPWYPSMKIFRQLNPGNWNSVFSEVIENLDTYFLSQAGSESDLFSNETLYLGLAKGDNFGWGICSMYLKKELSKFVRTVSIDENPELLELNELNGKVFHAITDVQFCSLYMVHGTKNIGYTFFENEIPKSSVEAAKKFDLILAGSTWCRDKMLQAGIKNVDILLQGIDHEQFFPSEENPSSIFRIFSGGKFEYRKGQDLVLNAVKHLQQKYDDVVLINAWYNLWPSSMFTMSKSKNIVFEMKGTSWTEFMENLYHLNGLDKSRIITLPLVPNSKLQQLYSKTDIGIFPNRCEGGTNLILMEYMACGKPVLASYNTGHKDVLNEKNSILLQQMQPCKLYDNNNVLMADWEEPDLDELIYKLEYAYFNRNELKSYASQAAEDLKAFTWERSAKELLHFIYG